MNIRTFLSLLVVLVSFFLQIVDMPSSASTVEWTKKDENFVITLGDGIQVVKKIGPTINGKYEAYPVAKKFPTILGGHGNWIEIVMLDRGLDKEPIMFDLRSGKLIEKPTRGIVMIGIVWYIRNRKT